MVILLWTKVVKVTGFSTQKWSAKITKTPNKDKIPPNTCGVALKK